MQKETKCRLQDLLVEASYTFWCAANGLRAAAADDMDDEAFKEADRLEAIGRLIGDAGELTLYCDEHEELAFMFSMYLKHLARDLRELKKLEETP